MISHLAFFGICLVGYVSQATALPWVHPSVEALDEINDAIIYKAVVESMNDWQKKQEQKRINSRQKRDDIPSVCYDKLGCFEASGPFGYLDTLPSNPAEIDTKFLMFPGRRMRKSGSPPAEVPFEKLEEAFEWAKQGFNSSLPTKVLIHGFGSDCSYIWVYEIRSALMAVEEVNIICVDWSNGAALPNYVKASANTRLIGKQLSLLLSGLVEKNGLSLRNTHLIGFSLGAHIAGFAGADLGNLSRITGLDPAGPLFESQDPRARLDQADADFVDVIHSNGENLILGGLGSSQPMGHVDFYPNGGRMQKGCSHLFVGAVSDIIWSSPIEGRSLCNHRRAYKFFIDSVSPRCHFPAFPCESYEDFLNGECFPCTDESVCGNMGYYADRSKGRGQLYLLTRDEEPFCAHQYHVKIESSSSPVAVKSYGKIQITLIGDNSLNETFSMTKKDDEEMRFGDTISRMIVPHPILSQLTKIEILYSAYSGWLSSGLTQWRIDKVTLMDSFGKMLSVCKKNLILESGLPMTLPLYPGECNLPESKPIDQAADRVHDVKDDRITNELDKKADFIPTQVVKVGLGDEDTEKEIPEVAFRNPVKIFNVPWNNEKENDLIEEAESSRAFNTRTVRFGNVHGSDEKIIREIVEPILSPLQNKHARSHDPEREKGEITEPILGPTTSKTSGVTKKPEDIMKKRSKYGRKHKDNGKFLDSVEESSDWVPTEVKVEKETKPKRRRQDESRILNGISQPSYENPIETLATTVQLLPQRIARMFEQAEKYAKENLLPFVSTYTPKFIAEIIVPKENVSKYVPLNYEEPRSSIISTKGISSEMGEARSSASKIFDPPPSKIKREDITTPYSNIQKIITNGMNGRKNEEIEKLSVVTAEYKSETTPVVEHTTSSLKEVTRRIRDDTNVQVNSKPKHDPLGFILNTAKEIPENIGRAFRDAERFTRDNVLPIVNSLTPKFITDLFLPKEQPRSIPFTTEESSWEFPFKFTGVTRNKRNRKLVSDDNSSADMAGISTDTIITMEITTALSNIQKIPPKKFK